MEFRGLLITFHLRMSVRPFVSSLPSTILQPLGLQHFIQIKLYLAPLNILDYTRLARSLDAKPLKWTTYRVCVEISGQSSWIMTSPSSVCIKCNLNPEQFAGLTFRLGRSFGGTPRPLFLRVQQPGSAQPWLGLGVGIHLHSIGILLVRLLATFSSGSLHFKFHYVLSGPWEFKLRLKRRKTKWAKTKVMT